MALTERQQKILDFIGASIDKHGYPPTIREIGKDVGISSTSVVNYHLNKLKDLELLERDDQISRGLKLTAKARPMVDAGNGATVSLPIVGTIQAGLPVPVMDARTAFETDEQDMISVTREIVPRGDKVYALRVKGDSMIDALINEGDIVVMQSTHTASNGDMVAAWIKDREETTLKRFYHENGRVRLQPANPTMDPIYVALDNLEIQGKVIAVIRSLN